jgi:hypothetical protein
MTPIFRRFAGAILLQGGADHGTRVVLGRRACAGEASRFIDRSRRRVDHVVVALRALGLLHDVVAGGVEGAYGYDVRARAESGHRGR